MTNTEPLTAEALAQFTGTERWYRYSLNRRIFYTEGVKYLADTAGAYWLLDEIALRQPSDARIAAEPFQLWKLTVRPDSSADLTCEDGNCHAVFNKAIPWTDFPLPVVKLYFTDNTILLPSEY